MSIFVENLYDVLKQILLYAGWKSAIFSIYVSNGDKSGGNIFDKLCNKPNDCAKNGSRTEKSTNIPIYADFAGI